VKASCGSASSSADRPADSRPRGGRWHAAGRLRSALLDRATGVPPPLAPRRLPGRALAGALGALALAAAACAPGAAPASPAGRGAPAAAPAASPGVAPTPAPAATARPVPDRIKMGFSSTSYTFLSMFIAQDEGFYARHGIEAELVQSTAQVGIAGMVNGDLDFSMSIGSFARAAARGLPIRVLEESAKAPLFYIVAQPEIQSLADLRGRIVSPVSIGGTNYQTLVLLLRKYGMDVSNVQLLPAGDSPRQMEMLRQRQVDAAVISPPYPLTARREGFRLLANAHEEVDLSLTGLSASQATISQRGDLVRRVIRAEIEALQFMHQDRAGAIRVMQQRFATDAALAPEAYDLIISAFGHDGSINSAGLETLLTLDKEEGAIPEHVTVEDIVDLQPLHDVQRVMGLLPR
jgi:ABC-type nitrate/sulfonate/bicarbonate transport system substrate-binding protein